MDENHLMYSKICEKIVEIYLNDHFSQEIAEAHLQRFRKQYLQFLDSLPNLGGKDNGQAQSVYDCIALFALYEILPEKPTLGVFEALVTQVFVPQMERASYANLNCRLVQRVACGIFRHIAHKGKDHEREWYGNYHMGVEPYDPEQGIRYHFTSCPIADFAKEHGYNHLMPAMCNPDYPMLAALKGGLIRTKTCAQDDCCDYWIVGSNSPFLQEHPQYRDENGYIRNK